MQKNNELAEGGFDPPTLNNVEATSTGLWAQGAPFARQCAVRVVQKSSAPLTTFRETFHRTAGVTRRRKQRKQHYLYSSTVRKTPPGSQTLHTTGLGSKSS